MQPQQIHLVEEEEVRGHLVAGEAATTPVEEVKPKDEDREGERPEIAARGNTPIQCDKISHIQNGSLCLTSVLYEAQS